MPDPIITDFLQPLIAPHVNMNGTDAEDLLEQVLDANKAVEKAQELMQVATPHGRDYLDASQLQVARRAWFERTQMLHKLSSELVALAIEINKQS